MTPTSSDPGSWVHEYIQHLAAELGSEFTSRQEGGKAIEELREPGVVYTKFLLAHNAEPDTVDLLEELKFLGKLTELVDENTHSRACQYMIR